MTDVKAIFRKPLVFFKNTMIIDIPTLTCFNSLNKHKKFNLFYIYHIARVLQSQTSIQNTSLMISVKTLSKIFILIAFFSVNANAQNVTIKGTVIDRETKLAISYTSIGVKNKAFGTVADSLGNFNLIFSQSSLSDLDTVVFGRIGYISARKTLKELKGDGLVIELVPSPINILETINIIGQRGKIVEYGKTPASMYLTPRAYASVPRNSDVKGREQATILDVDGNIALKEINFLLVRNNYTKVGYRINFYTVNNDRPDKLLSTKDVIYETKETSGWKNIDLGSYNIHINGQKRIAVALQLIKTEISPNDTAKTSFLVPSYPSPLKKSYFREKSESEWMPVKSSYLYVNIKAFKLKGNGQPVDKSISIEQNQPISNDHKKLMFGINPDVGKRVAVDSATIYYESYGKGEPLILLHGNNESMASFREQIIFLSEKFNVIAIDSRGQGNSIDLSKSPYTYELFAKDIIGVIDNLGISKTNVLGWSDGGNVGLILASQYPDRINRLCVFGANLFPGKEAIDEDVIRIFEKRKLDLMKASAPSSFNELRLTNLVLEQPNIKIDQLKKITSSVLVMAGEKDIVKYEHTRLISSSISQSKLYIFSKGDHYIPIKQPKDFNDVVVKFMIDK